MVNVNEQSSIDVKVVIEYGVLDIGTSEDRYSENAFVEIRASRGTVQGQSGMRHRVRRKLMGPTLGQGFTSMQLQRQKRVNSHIKIVSSKG